MKFLSGVQPGKGRSVPKVTEQSVLLRARIELPVRLKVAATEFREGWDLVQSGNASGLEEKVRTCGWNFIRITDGMLRSGVGETAQQAIGGALKLALRGVSEYFNIMEIGRIQLTRYPWFVLARVIIHPLRIQQSAIRAVPDDALPLPSFTRKRHSPACEQWHSLPFGNAMPLLEETLLLHGSVHERAS